jgi:predicted nucleotidyltransferase
MQLRRAYDGLIILKDCDMDARDLLEEKREDILRIAKRYGARNLRIFGSVARGDAGPESDVDFLVELEPGRTLFDLGGLLYELRELLGIPVDVVTEKGLRDHVRPSVLKEAVPL